ncbi:uncharacterized protein LOC142334006 [Lycorma delicatula]|uniref:uncharacterized protein LOC142334006 n=1 Tax=Lycorma delicatula TaxID=130591 RepID=UPI003F515040
MAMVNNVSLDGEPCGMPFSNIPSDEYSLLTGNWKSSLSDRLKSVEDEITSLMSVNGSVSRTSFGRSSSDTNTSIDKSSTGSSSGSSVRVSKRSGNVGGVGRGGVGGGGGGGGGVNSRTRINRSRSAVLESRVRDGYQSSRSSDSVGHVKHLSSVPPVVIPSTCVGDNIMIPSYESMHSYLQSINNVQDNQLLMSKIADNSSGITDFSKSNSAPCSGRIHTPKKTISLMKQLEEEKSKRFVAERTIEELKLEIKNYKQEIKRNKELYNKYCELSEHLEKENSKQAEQLRLIEKTKAEAEVENELSKQKYETIIKDFNMEQEHAWVQQTEIQQLKECLEQSQLKIQELMGARTMAVELAHDLQKRHQTCVTEHQHRMQELKNKYFELEKLYTESNEKKICLMDRLQSLEKISLKYEQLQEQLNECKKKLDEAEMKITDFSRNPEMVPQVRSLLNAQEETYKAVLNEKATNDMALQAKYTTLEVELQIIQDECNLKVSNLEKEHECVIEENKKKLEEQLVEIDKLKLVVKELTDVSTQYKARITELSDINKHQEVLIKCQNEAISSKEERVKLCNQEAELNVRRIEQEMKSLQLDQEKIRNSLQKKLEEEQDKVKVKDKVADDQTETIIKLKQNLADKSKELQKKTKELHHLELSLKNERQEKENLSSDVQHLKMHRVHLNETITQLQTKVENLKTSSASNVHKKHTQMLEELEKKVAEKQSEWESEISKLRKERDQARETAQYAIENLSSAMEEYQKELNNQKSLQTNLASLIRDKEEQLNFAEKRTGYIQMGDHSMLKFRIWMPIADPNKTVRK